MSQTLLEAHNQWANRPNDERYETLEALASAVSDRRLRSRSIDIDTSRTTASTDGKLLTINGQITPCEPTHWAFGQLSSLVGAPAAYLRKLPQPLLVDCLNHGLKSGDRESVKFMTIAEQGDVNTLQAVTSTTYGRIWDADCVAAVGRIVERSNGRFYNPKAYVNNGQGFKGITGEQKPSGLYASDRDVFMFMIDGGSLLDIGPRAQLNRGFIVWNSEVGAKTFGLMTFLFNMCCGNHIIMGASEVNKLLIRHSSGSPARFDREAMPALLDYANASASPIETTVRKAQATLIWDGKDTSFDALFTDLNKTSKFSRPELKSAIAFAKSEEGDCRSLWQLVQGFTAYARGFDYIDARVDLESRAGKLLSSLQP